MRTLNLSRLARVSESQFFKNEQAHQAISLRKTLTEADLQTSKSSNSHAATTTATASADSDVLSEISAHSAHRQFIHHAFRDHPIRSVPQRPPISILPAAGEESAVAPASTFTARSSTKGIADATILRALGSSRLSLYREVAQSTPARPLPGGAKYAEGAVVGLASFSIATALVASVGVAGAFILWQRPSIVETWRKRSIALHDSLDHTIGHRIRQSLSTRIHAGQVISHSTRERASSFAHAAVGIPRYNQRPPETGHPSQEE